MDASLCSHQHQNVSCTPFVLQPRLAAFGKYTRISVRFLLTAGGWSLMPHATCLQEHGILPVWWALLRPCTCTWCMIGNNDRVQMAAPQRSPLTAGGRSMCPEQAAGAGRRHTPAIAALAMLAPPLQAPRERWSSLLMLICIRQFGTVMRCLHCTHLCTQLAATLGPKSGVLSQCCHECGRTCL